MTNSNELPPIELPELRAAVQSHLDARAGAEGVNALETYVVVSTYVREDGTAGLEVVTNAPDAQRVADVLGLAAECVMPSVEPADE